jgi:ferredoxin-NADP reductase
MDTNYRGGPAGFVRTRLTPADSTSSQKERHEVLYPEYSGNNLLQTLGNLYTTPVAGLVFPDFTTGDVLYVTGDVTLLFGSEAEAVMPRSYIVVKLAVTAGRFVKAGLGVRLATAEKDNEQKELKGMSPYNPKVRLLASELIKSNASQHSDIPAARQTATLLSQTPLSPTISRFAFTLSNPGTTWKPGQYIILDFSNELDPGYSHMRDDDPRSLNDDFVRSFTVSSTPPPLPISSTDQGPGALLGTDASTKVAQAQDESRGSTFELTLRKISGGPVTEYLFKHGLSGTRNTTLPLEVGVKGFEGAFAFDIEKAVGAGQDGRLVFVASGVGITPLLAQLELSRRKDLLKRVLVIWSLRVDDLGFAIDVLERDGEFASRVKLFVTGEAEDHTSPPSEAEAHILSLQKLKQVCASIEPRRFDETDFKDLNTTGNVQMDQVLVCANPIVNAAVKQWLQRLGINAVTEDFAY